MTALFAAIDAAPSDEVVLAVGLFLVGLAVLDRIVVWRVGP